MKIFRYWALEERIASDPEGESVHLRAWGGDNLSPERARHAAQARMAGWLENLNVSLDAFFSATEYPYPERILREEVLEGELDGARPDEWHWAITRNRYGAQVLNTASLAILDIDRRPRGFWGWLSTLGASRARLDRRVRRRLTAWLAVSPEVALRLYETPNGFRALLLHRPFETAGADIQKLMREVGTDRLYARLCANQGSFRARLTPQALAHRPAPRALAPLVRAGCPPARRNRVASALRRTLPRFCGVSLPGPHGPAARRRSRSGALGRASRRALGGVERQAAGLIRFETLGDAPRPGQWCRMKA